MRYEVEGRVFEIGGFSHSSVEHHVAIPVAIILNKQGL